MRVGIVLVGCMSTLVAITVTSIYGLFHLCSDLVYVCLFPQLLAVVYMPKSNIYGAAAGLFVGLFLRVTGGEPLIKFPPLIYYPWWYEKDGIIYQNFPFKTLAMIISMLMITCVSYATHYVFTNGILSESKDFWNGVVRNCNDDKGEKELDDLTDKQDIMKGDYATDSNGWPSKVHAIYDDNEERLRLKRNSESDVVSVWITF